MLIATLVRATRLLRPTLQGRVSGLLIAAKLSCRLLGWANTVRLWQELFGRPAVALSGSAAAVAQIQLDAALRAAVAESALSHACKERGLAGWAIARSRGLNARLFIGICLCPVHGHCWAQIGDTLLGDDEDQVGQYEPILSYA